jgi:hypothetical protein
MGQNPLFLPDLVSVARPSAGLLGSLDTSKSQILGVRLAGVLLAKGARQLFPSRGRQ